MARIASLFAEAFSLHYLMAEWIASLAFASAIGANLGSKPFGSPVVAFFSI